MASIELVGHEEPRQRFARAACRGRLGHAFLFVGPEGIGKRQTAWYLAQALLCERQGLKPNQPVPPREGIASFSLHPCGQCGSCLLVAGRTHPDVLEIRRPTDKNVLPVDDIRELCRLLALRAASGGYKIAIVDDADLLAAGQGQTANAFLKTLEEPPAGSLLLLIGTEVETQLATITSRCQVVRFQPLTQEQVATILQPLRPELDATALAQAARLADGSVRRALDLTKATDDWRQTRLALLTGLTQRPVPAVTLTETVLRWAETGTKDSSAIRQRLRDMIRLTADFYSSTLRWQQAGLPPAEPTDAPLVEKLAVAATPDVLVDLLDRCLQADFHLARFLNQTLVMEGWLDDLARLSTGVVLASSFSLTESTG